MYYLFFPTLKYRFEKKIELQRQGNWFVAVYHARRDGKSFAYVLPLIEAKSVSYTQFRGYQDPNPTEYSISRNPVENSTPVIVPDVELFYLVVENYQHPIWFDLLFLLGFLIVSLALYAMYKVEKLHMAVVCFLTAAWVVVYWLFEKDYTLMGLKQTAIFSPDLFFTHWSGPSLFDSQGSTLGHLIFFTSIFLFFVSSFVRWLEQWVLKTSWELGPFIVANLFMQASLWVLVKVLSTGVNLVHDGQINLDFQQFHVAVFQWHCP